MKPISITAYTPEQLTLSGDMVFETVPNFWREWKKSGQDLPTCLDLSGIQAVDSSALSLLLSFKRQAGGQLQIQGQPAALESLAKLTSTLDLLNDG